MNLPPMEWIERIIRIDSVTHHGNEELVRFLHPLLRAQGLKVEEQQLIENGETYKNILAFSHSPDAPGLIVLNSHLDTVTPGTAALWTRTGGDPLSATRIRDRIYGLGTADVKLDFLCKLVAAGLAKPWSRPFALVGTYGEETGLRGAKQVLGSKRLKPRYALVGQPSNLELIYSHKGQLVLTVVTELERTNGHHLMPKQWKGRASHSSTPSLGVNALRKALNDILRRGYGIVRLESGPDVNKVPDFCEAELLSYQGAATRKLLKFIQFMDDLERDLKKRKDTRFSPPTSTLSLNRAVTINHELHLTMDIRTLPDLDLERFRDRLQTHLSGMAIRLDHHTIHTPLRGKKDSPLMKEAFQVLKDCGLKAVKQTKASSTEASVYQQFGAEAIVFGPGTSIGNVHRPNEYNSVRQMAAAVKFYSTLLKTVGGG